MSDSLNFFGVYMRNSQTSWSSYSIIRCITLIITMTGVTSGNLLSAAWAQPAEAASQTSPTLTLTQAAKAAYQSGDNSGAARLGLAALKQDPSNHDLRLKTANALSWTGQFPEALNQYRALLESPLKDKAMLGLANVNLWSGRPDIAAGLYTSILQINSADIEAQEGLQKANKQLRPRSEIRVVAMRDSESRKRDLLVTSHQWRSNDLMRKYEVIVEGGNESGGDQEPDLSLRDLAFVVEDFSLPLSPKLRIEKQDSPVNQVFAELGLKLSDIGIDFDIGHVNWSRIAFNPLASRDGLTANKFGISGRQDTSIGKLSGKFTHYDISDGNVVRSASAEYWPAWQPLLASTGVKLFTGVFNYKADFTDDRYWSPSDGHLLGFIGGTYGLWKKDYEVFALVRRSFLIDGEGSGGTYVSMSGKRWIGKDWAVRAEATLLSTDRVDDSYRSQSLTLAIDRYW